MNTWYKSLFIVFVLKMVFKCGEQNVHLTVTLFFLHLKSRFKFWYIWEWKKSGAKVSGVRTIEADGIKGLS